jgi:ATP-dependent RNA helicase RhlE
MMSFQDLGLRELVVEKLEGLGFHTPTSVQEKIIPLILEGHDVLGIAQTGTGKTGAFGLPVLQKILSIPREKRKAQPRALILVPTRELSLQIVTALKSFQEGIIVSAVYGGVSLEDQVKELNLGVEVVVATPGRLLDLLNQKLINLGLVEFFILDEADRMLDLGFMDDIESIVQKLPVKRQTMLFSATMPGEIERISGKILSNPVKVEVTPVSSVADGISEKLFYVKRNDKYQLLKKILKESEVPKTIVFTRTKTSAENVVEYLTQNRIASKAMHGDREQSDRERSLHLFREGSIKVLIATDIASRGIDVQDVSLVINFELPGDPESYVHRIGRTGRAGRTGKAISFCDETEKLQLEKIQKLIGSYLPSEKFTGKPEVLRFKNNGMKKVTPPTPGKSQEKTAYLDHSKRQIAITAKEHPGFKNKKKKRK